MNNENKKVVKVEIKKENEIKLSVNYIKYIDYIINIKKKNSLKDDEVIYNKVVNKRFSNKKRIFKRMNDFINNVNDEVVLNVFNKNKKELNILIEDYKKENVKSNNSYFLRV